MSGPVAAAPYDELWYLLVVVGIGFSHYVANVSDLYLHNEGLSATSVCLTFASRHRISTPTAISCGTSALSPFYIARCDGFSHVIDVARAYLDFRHGIH